jgi:benzodiazapine receptor
MTDFSQNNNLENKTSLQYKNLIRPSWAPPSWVFGPVWTILYIIIFVTYIMVFHKSLLTRDFWLATPFILNLVFNFSYTPLMFGWNRRDLALGAIIGVLITLIWGMYMAHNRKLRSVVLWNIPYLLWILFATSLQVSIMALNYNRKNSKNI